MSELEFRIGIMSELELLRARNIERGKEWVGDDSTLDNELFRAVEHGGESGELLNIVKKLYRHANGWVGNVESHDELIAKLKDEVADVLITLDRVADHYDIDLFECTVDKFNKTTVKNGLSVMLLPHFYVNLANTTVAVKEGVFFELQRARSGPGDNKWHEYWIKVYAADLEAARIIGESMKYCSTCNHRLDAANFDCPDCAPF